MRFRKKIPRKEWTGFDELQDLLDKLQMTDTNFIMITGCASSTFYIWKRKGKVPANILSKLKEEMAKYFKSEYDRKCQIIWGKDEN